MKPAPGDPPLPSPEVIRLAVSLYLQNAYPDGPAPRWVQEALPPAGPFQPALWLMGEAIERMPEGAALEEVRSFRIRLGNAGYRHMKLRIARPPRDRRFLFSVDSHDVFLEVPPDSPDHESLEELRRWNLLVAVAIQAAWDLAGLPTERSYLREKIQEARESEGAGG